MPNMKVILDAQGCWPEMETARTAGKLVEVEIAEIAMLPNGMSSGAPSVAVRIDLPDGTFIFAQTSLKLLCLAADAFRVRYAALNPGSVLVGPAVGKSEG